MYLELNIEIEIQLQNDFLINASKSSIISFEINILRGNFLMIYIVSLSRACKHKLDFDIDDNAVKYLLDYFVSKIQHFIRNHVLTER